MSAPNVEKDTTALVNKDDDANKSDEKAYDTTIIEINDEITEDDTNKSDEIKDDTNKDEKDNDDTEESKDEPTQMKHESKNTVQLEVDPNFVPKDYIPKIRPSIAETVEIPPYDPKRRLSKIEMDDMKKQIETFTNALIEDPKTAVRRYTLDQEEKEQQKDEETTAAMDSVQEQTNAQQQQPIVSLQHMLQKQKPSVRDLLEKKVTWRDFLGVYNVLRISIAAFFAVLIWLSVAALAYALNPNTCKPYRVKSHRIQWHPIANDMVMAWSLCLVVIPIFKIFGHEWLWTPKKVNIIILIVCCSTSIVFIFKGFIYDPTGEFNEIYLIVVAIVIMVVSMIYFFISNGFYLVWLTTPFIVVMLLGFGFIAGTQFVLRGVLTPSSPFFGATYSLMMTILETIVLKFTKYTFPYTWGRFYTCPCNRNKFKSKIAKNYEEEKVTVENELSDVVLFYVSMIFMSAIEAVRVTGYVLAKDDIGSLISMILMAIILEAIARNNLSWEFIYQIILKKELPGWGRVYAVWFGAKYQGEYVPIWCILFMNLVNYGPFKYCSHIRPWRENPLADNVNLGGDIWLFFVMFGAEFLADIVSEIVLRIGRYNKWFGVKNEKGEDPPRQKILVKVNLFPMMWILVHSYVVATYGFMLDNSNRGSAPTPAPTLAPTMGPTETPPILINY